MSQIKWAGNGMGGKVFNIDLTVDRITGNGNGHYPRIHEATVSGEMTLVDKVQELEFASGEFALVNRVVNKTLKLESVRALIGESFETGTLYLHRLYDDALAAEIASAPDLHSVL